MSILILISIFIFLFMLSYTIVFNTFNSFSIFYKIIKYKCSLSIYKYLFLMCYILYYIISNDDDSYNDYVADSISVNTPIQGKHLVYWAYMYISYSICHIKLSYSVWFINIIYIHFITLYFQSISIFFYLLSIFFSLSLSSIYLSSLFYLSIYLSYFYYNI